MNFNDYSIFVGGISYETSVENIQNFFRKFHYDVRHVKLFKGFAFVDMCSQRDTEAAIWDLNGKSLCGNYVTVAYRRTGSITPYTQKAEGPVTDYPLGTFYRLKVDNLSLSVSWKDLKQFMQKAGEVVYADAHRYYDKQGVVQFASRQGMIKALKTLNGQLLHQDCIYLHSPKEIRKSHFVSRSRYVDNQDFQIEYRYTPVIGHGTRLRQSKKDKSNIQSRIIDSAASGSFVEKWESSTFQLERSSSYHVYDQRKIQRESNRDQYEYKSSSMLKFDISPKRARSHVREVHYPPKSKRSLSDARSTSSIRKKSREIPVSKHKKSRTRHMSTPDHKLTASKKKSRNLFQSSCKESDLLLISPLPKCSSETKFYANCTSDSEPLAPSVPYGLVAKTDSKQTNISCSALRSSLSIKRNIGSSTLRRTRSLKLRSKGPRTPSYTPPVSDQESIVSACSKYSLKVGSKSSYSSPKYRLKRKELTKKHSSKCVSLPMISCLNSKCEEVESFTTFGAKARKKNTHRNSYCRSVTAMNKSRLINHKCSSSSSNSDWSSCMYKNFSASECLSSFSEHSSSCSKNAEENLSVGNNSLMQVSDIEGDDIVNQNIGPNDEKTTVTQ